MIQVDLPANDKLPAILRVDKLNSFSFQQPIDVLKYGISHQLNSHQIFSR